MEICSVYHPAVLNFTSYFLSSKRQEQDFCPLAGFHAAVFPCFFFIIRLVHKVKETGMCYTVKNSFSGDRKMAPR